MQKDVIILVVDDDDGHATLIKKNLQNAGVTNKIIRFEDGQEVLNYLFKKGNGPVREDGVGYLILLDIRMPKIDGIEVLRQMKSDKELQKIPVIMLTTTDDPREVEKCHEIGCSSYITKPIDYVDFMQTIKHLGLFITITEIPKINGIIIQQDDYE